MSSITHASTPGRDHRVLCLERLARAVRAPSDRRFAWLNRLVRHLHLVLWELPLHVQAGLAVATAERYLPAFERKHPHLSQLRELFVRCLTTEPPTDHEVDMWAGSLSREDRGDLADDALHVAASRVAEALRDGAAPITVTSACGESVVYAIGSAEHEAWMAVDPEAVEARRERLRRSEADLPPMPFEPLKYRDPWHHPEVRDAVCAGWDAVVAWLRAADVGQYPAYVDRKSLATLLREEKKLPRVVYPPHPDESTRATR
jgi:hypothetical protein